MPDAAYKAHDTFPALVAILMGKYRPIDLTNASAIKVELKGLTVLVTGTCTKLTVVTPTGNTTTGSNVITNLSAVTNIVLGSSIQGAGIPVGAKVDDISGSQIVMVDGSGNALNATATATAVALTFNTGTVSYSWGGTDLAAVDNYNTEFEITWPGGIQTVPNSGYATISVTQDLENA